MADEAQKSKSGAGRPRSPSFPFIPLETAITRLEQFSGKFGRHPAPATKAGIAWGMKEASSQASQTLAALKSFGLVEYETGPSGRAVVLSDDGRTYLRAQQEEIKKNILRRSALKPKEIAKYWEDWRTDPPIEEVRLDDLVLQGGYTDEGAKTFLRVYDSTIAYAGLADSGNLAVDNGDLEEENPRDRSHKPGDRTDPPKMDPQKPPKRRQLEPGMKEATFPLDEGTGVVQWPEPLSEESYKIFEQFVQLALLRAKASVSAGEKPADDDKGSGDR